MKIVSVEQKLKEVGLEPPRLNALQADDTLYTMMAHQPPSRLSIAPGSIGHASPAEAKRLTQSLLNLVGSLESQPNLVINPEYSVPWEALAESVEEGNTPAPSKFWALGYESLQLGGLTGIRERLGAKAIVLDDDLSPFERATQSYRNPLAYVFRTKIHKNHKHGSGGASEYAQL